MKSQHYEYTVECLRSMAELRSSDSFPFQREVDYAVGQAVKKFGPRNVLDAVPLEITGVEFVPLPLTTPLPPTYPYVLLFPSPHPNLFSDD